MSKYLILEFKNAGLFRRNIKTKDKIFDLCNQRDRKDEFEFVEPITVFQISNMLHVLFGERPVSSVRASLYKSILEIEMLAKNSYLKITSYCDSSGKYQSEKIQLNKAVWNSWNPQSFMNWERVKKLLGDELFMQFSEMVKDVFKKNISEISFNEVKCRILQNKDERIDKMFVILNKNGKKPLFDSIYGKGNEPTNINKNSRTILTVLSGLDNIIRLSGQIMVPITEENLVKIKQNKGCATILDGGMVYIKDIIPSNFANPIEDGFKLVSEISIEKK